MLNTYLIKKKSYDERVPEALVECALFTTGFTSNIPLNFKRIFQINTQFSLVHYNFY